MTESANHSQSLDASSICAAFSDVVGKTSQSLEIVRLAGDASTRSYHRVVKKNSSTDRPEMSWILQSAESFDLNSADPHPFLAGQRVLRTVGVRVPKIVATSGDRGWILMEDLTDETLQGHAEDRLYRKAIDLLVMWTLHAHPANPNLAADVKKLPQFSWAFDTEKLEFEMGFTRTHLFETFLGLDGARFREAAAPNSAYLAAQPRFYCHRDYHCRNLMYFEDSLAVIDFQDARMGPITYDLVSILWDPYVRLSDGRRADLLDYWRKQLISACQFTPWIDLAHVKRSGERAGDWNVELERMKIQRLLKAAGSYASFFNVKGRKDYLPATFGALDDTLGALDGLLTKFPNFAFDSDRVLREEVTRLRDAFAKKMETFG